jgi:hypothetical protein
MTTQQENVLKPKLGLLELAKQLGNVSYSCKIMAYSRATFGVHLSTVRRSLDRHRCTATHSSSWRPSTGLVGSVVN